MTEQWVDLDAVTERAWRDFRGALADALEALGEGAFLCVELAGQSDEDDGATPYVQAMREGDEVRLEVVSNRFLGASHRLRKPARRHLRGLGLDKPSQARPNYSAAYTLSHVDEAAAVAVSAFRDAFGVVHPAFLHSDDVIWQDEVEPPVEPDTEGRAGATYPVDHEHLDRLVDEALTPMLGHTPRRDGDGDIPIIAGSAVVFVRTWPRRPVIRVFAHMVTDIGDLAAAVDEVAELNRAVEGVKFTLVEDLVVASADLLALPFAPEHLVVLVNRVCDVVSANDARLARRVGGRVFLDQEAAEEQDAEEEPDDASDEIHPVMLQMLHLEAERPGSLRPKLAAKLCSHDTDLIVELIRWNEQQEIAWRDARDQARELDDADEAAACEHERAHARRTVKVLRKALRRVLVG